MTLCFINWTKISVQFASKTHYTYYIYIKGIHENLGSFRTWNRNSEPA